MHLRDLLDLCQADRGEGWVVLPRRGPLGGMLVSLVDRDDPIRLLEAEDSLNAPTPALSVRRHSARAVYGPMPELGLAWGMPAFEHDDGPEFDWLPDGRWRPDMTDLEIAHVLLNGTPIWEVRYLSLVRTDGAGGVLPWPQQVHGGEVNEISTWESGFVELISELAEHTASYDYQGELDITPIAVRPGHPLDHETHR
jgi:hypothetical protein